MKHVLLLAHIFLFLSGHAQQETIREYYESGQLKFEGLFEDGKKNGAHKWWYRNGQLEFELSFKNDKKNGMSKGWWKNGLLEYQGNFEYDKRDGEWEAYYENGKLRKKSNFLLQRRISEECFDEKGKSSKCADIIDSIWWWKDDICFDLEGNVIDCHEFYFGIF